MSDLGSRPSRWLWMIRPDKILFGPIFAKEVITSGRRASTYWTRGLFALAIAGLVSLFLWGHWEERAMKAWRSGCRTCSWWGRNWRGPSSGCSSWW